jgi:Pyruvate/2-oxoacid:ferredoxin oxidoreductase gamma subunit
MNSARAPEEVDLGVKLSKVATLDATGVAIEVFGPTAIPITNTAMLGALSAATGWVKLGSLFEPITERFSGQVGERNISAAKLGYERVKVKKY